MQVWGTEDAPLPGPRKVPCPEGAYAPPLCSENPQLPILFQPLPGVEKGDPDLPAKIWGGGLRKPPKCIA